MTPVNKIKKLSSSSVGKANVARNLSGFDPEYFKKIAERKSEKLVFSFELFDKTHEAFNLGNIETDWYSSLFETLSIWSKHSWVELNNDFRRIYDPHLYNCKTANVKNISDYIDVDQHDLYQLRLSKSKGRVHGVIIGNRFYILWLDRHHNMYDADHYPKYNDCLFIAPKTAYEQLCDEKNNLLLENNNLKEENEFIYSEISNDICVLCDHKFKLKK